jgi:hypothetical protein
LTLARQRGMSESQAGELARQVRSELSDVADIALVVGPKLPPSGPGGWMASGPIEAYDLHERTDDELEAISHDRLNQRLLSIGADTNYKPEQLPNSISSLEGYIPNVDAKSLDDAVKDFVDATSLVQDPNAIRKSIKSALNVIQDNQNSQRAIPKVVGESESEPASSWH